MCPRRLLVVGNGSTAINEQGIAFVNRHTAEFLQGVNVLTGPLAFLQPGTSHSTSGNLHDAPYFDQTSVIVLPRASGMANAVKNLWRIVAAIVAARFVYIFFPGTLPAFIIRICRLFRKPYGIYLRGDPAVSKGNSENALINAQFIITVSNSLVKERHGSSRVHGRIIRIRPMLDISESDIHVRDFIRRPGGRWRLLFVGRVEEAKGILELIDAAKLLFWRSFPFELTIVGGGPLLDKARAAVAEVPGLPVQLLGPISERNHLARIYEANDVFVLPTHHEGFPRVLYEAMIRSMVIITTPVGGIPELMIDGENCVLVPPRAALSIADAVEALCRSPADMQRLSQAGLSVVHSVITSYPSHIEAFRKALNG